MSLNEVTQAIATSTGAPVTYERCTVEAFHEQLREAGVSDNVAAMMAEVPHAVNIGKLSMLQPRTPGTTTPTTLEDFVKTEFVPALTSG